MVARLKKKYFIIIILFFLLFVFGIFLLNTQNPKLIQIKRYIPTEIKDFLKDTIFYIPSVIKLNSAKDKEIERLELKVHKLENTKGYINEDIFPQTQFLKLKSNQMSLENIETRFEYVRYGEIVKPFYLEYFNDKIFLVFKDGSIYSAQSNKILDNNNKDDFFSKNQVLKLIDHNLPKNIEVSDILYFNNKLFISFSNKDENSCNLDDLNIFSSEIDTNNFEFEKVINISNKLNAEDNNYDCIGQATVGGKMEGLKNGKILISTPQIINDNILLEKIEERDENFKKTFKYSLFIEVDLFEKSYDIISVGHRNPIGVVQDPYSGTIIATEHGPRGGDEINKIIKGKNYGWPFVSYGEPYAVKKNEPYFFKKNHSKQGFREPIYSFVPSIGISHIIKVDNEFSEKWKNNFLITSLKKKSIYRVEFDENFTKVKFIEQIKLGKRIRDIIYIKKYKAFVLALEDKDGFLGVIKNFDNY